MDNTLKYLKMIAFILLYVGVYLIISNLIGVVYGLAYVIGQMINGSGSIDQSAFTTALYKNSVYFTIISAIFVIPTYWFILWLRKQKLRQYCGFEKITPKNIILSALVGIALVLPVSFIIDFLSIDKLSPGTEQIFNTMFSNNTIPILLLSVGIAAPILEEILFRGLVFNELRKALPIPVAIVFQGLLFGLIHFNLTQFIYASALGILFGFVYIWIKSIWATIVIHIFFNSANILQGEFFNMDIIYNWYFTIISTIGVIMLLLIIWNNRKKNQKYLNVKECS